MKITSENKSEFRDIASSEGYKVVLKILETLINSQEQSVLTCNLEGGSQEEKDKLFNLRCQLNGAKKLYRDFRAYESRLKNETDGRVIQAKNTRLSEQSSRQSLHD